MLQEFVFQRARSYIVISLEPFALEPAESQNGFPLIRFRCVRNIRTPRKSLGEGKHPFLPVKNTRHIYVRKIVKIDKPTKPLMKRIHRLGEPREPPETIISKALSIVGDRDFEMLWTSLNI